MAEPRTDTSDGAVSGAAGAVSGPAASPPVPTPAGDVAGVTVSLPPEGTPASAPVPEVVEASHATAEAAVMVRQALEDFARAADSAPGSREGILLAALLDLLPDFFYVHNSKLEFQYANKAAADYFGISKDEIVGRALLDLEPDPEQARFYAEVCRNVMREGKPRLTDGLPLRTKDGRVRFLRQHDIPFVDPHTGETMLLGLSRDVTEERELAEERLRRAGLERELTIARQIQESLRPDEALDVPGYELASWFEPAAYAGGDFYDWSLIDRGEVALCVGDVTGHGVGPGLLAASCRAYARTLINVFPMPEAMRRLNRQLLEDLSDGRFITFAGATLEPRSGRVIIQSAGHGPIMVLRAGRGEVETIPTHGPPLGLGDDQSLETPTTTTLAPGDALALVSDGVYEARNDRGEQFGLDRLRSILRRGVRESAPAGELAGAVAQAVTMFGHTNGREDDATVVVVRRCPDADAT